MPKRVKDRDPIDVMVGQKLRLLRELKHWSQQRLGEKIGVSRIKVGQFESGQSSVPSSTLFKISQVFDVDASHFFSAFGEEEISTDGPNPMTLLSDRAFLKILKDFGSLNDPNVRQSLSAVLERMAQLSQK